MIGSRFAFGSGLVPVAFAIVPLGLVCEGGWLGLALIALADLLLLTLAWFDSRLWTPRSVTCQRAFQSRLVVGVPTRVTLSLQNLTDRSQRLTVRDVVPSGWRPSRDEFRVALAPGARLEVDYDVVPRGHGRARFGDLVVHIESRLRLGARVVWPDSDQEVLVHPAAVLDWRRRLNADRSVWTQNGIRSVRRRGGGGEFEQLREYVPGDSHRDIDWKCTAKRLRPITRVFGQERSQNVLIAIDIGRSMLGRAGPEDKVERAVATAMTLAFVALKQGDRVGLVVFDSAVQRFVAPRRGNAHYRQLQQVLYSIEARETNTDFVALATFLRRNARKRSLLVVLSGTLDEAYGAPLAEGASMLRRAHLPICLMIGDPSANDAVNEPLRDPRAVYRRAAAIDRLAERRRVRAEIEQHGIRVIEASGAQLALRAINQYIEVKSHGRL